MRESGYGENEIESLKRNGALLARSGHEIAHGEEYSWLKFGRECA